MEHEARSSCRVLRRCSTTSPLSSLMEPQISGFAVDEVFKSLGVRVKNNNAKGRKEKKSDSITRKEEAQASLPIYALLPLSLF